MKNSNLINSAPVPKLYQLYKDLFSGGKGLRAQLVEEVATSLNLEKPLIDMLKESIEGIHHSSLLHDDVLDVSLLRRNRLTAWAKFSKNKAILAGDFLLAQVSYNISECGNMDIMKLTAQTVKNMVHGEWLQEDQKGKETLADLDKVHILKTSSLFQWCLKTPFLFFYSKDTSVLKLIDNIGKIFGQLFQRADDCIDFGVRNKENKNAFKDLKEGYLNFFGLWMKEQLGLSEKNIRSCQNLKDLKTLIGEKNLNQQLEKFDRMNDDLIGLCTKNVEELSNLINPSQRKVIDVLKLWPQKLYFRD